MPKQGKKSKDKIEMISEIRARNNVLWMGLLKLAVETSPRRARLLLAEITKNDRKISRLFGGL